LWEPHLIKERTIRNCDNIDRALQTILDEDRPSKAGDIPRVAFDPDKWKKYASALPRPDDTAARKVFADSVLKDLKDLGMIAMGDDSGPTSLNKYLDDLIETLNEIADSPETTTESKPVARSLLDRDGVPADDRERAKHDEFASAIRSLSVAIEQNGRYEAQLDFQRSLIRKNIDGRAVMIGWSATARTDFFPTAIQPTCPGVVIHGMAFNAIMTRDFWYHVPKWVTALITLGLGLTITAANGLFKPGGALIMAILLGTAYLFLNGLVLFDRYRVLAGVAGPMVALGSVWATGTLASFLIESRERARITKRFSSYNDPKLVNFFIENPEANMDGQVREMSVVFTDLAGFTTLSERLGERTVPILSRYFSIMVPIIRRNNGYVNKFLGDGIMCFFNAPDDDPDHAAHAVQTVLEMQRGMRQFADELVAEGLPRVSMRCGVSTGTMVVGDSGPSDGCDYTVLGDTVNFASRLEGANKAVGTYILISHRTTELLGNSRFLLRPVGKLQVVGKSEGVMTYEPLAPFDDATPQDMILATMGTEMIAAYFAKDFAKCIEFADKMDAQIGATKLPGLYRKAALKYIENPPGAEFQGNLILTEK
jgi:adenylate cyclase